MGETARENYVETSYVNDVNRAHAATPGAFEGLWALVSALGELWLERLAEQYYR